MSPHHTMNDIKGKFVNIVLSVEEGRGFDCVKCPFLITGNFNGRIIESDVVGPKPHVVFSTEMVWETEKKLLRKARGSYARVRVDCFCTENRKCIGFALMCLRSAKIIVTGGGRLNSMDVQFTWTKLLNVSNEFRRGSPELNLALTIRDCIRFKPPAPQMDPLPSLSPEPSPEQQPSIPSIYTEDGFIQLGDPSETNEIYQIKITIFTSHNMDVLLPEALVFSQSPKRYYIVFEIFGMAVQTRQLSRDLHNLITFQEQLIINLQTSYNILHNYFENYPKVTVKFFNNDTLLGSTIMNMTHLGTDIEPKVFFLWNDSHLEMSQICYFDRDDVESSLLNYIRPAYIGVEFELDMLECFIEEIKDEEISNLDTPEENVDQIISDLVLSETCVEIPETCVTIPETCVRGKPLLKNREETFVLKKSKCLQTDDNFDIAKRLFEISRELIADIQNSKKNEGTSTSSLISSTEIIESNNTRCKDLALARFSDISLITQYSEDEAKFGFGQYFNDLSDTSVSNSCSCSILQENPLLYEDEFADINLLDNSCSGIIKKPPEESYNPNLSQISLESGCSESQIAKISEMSKRFIELSRGLTHAQLTALLNKKPMLLKIEETSESPIISARGQTSTQENELNQTQIDEITEMSERILNLSRQFGNLISPRHELVASGPSNISLFDNRTRSKFRDRIYDSYYQFCLDIILETILWKSSPMTTDFILRFIHPKDTTYLEIGLEIDKTLHQRIHLENAICKLMFISSKQRLSFLLSTYCPQMELRHARTKELIADVVTLICHEVTCEKPEASYVIALQNLNGNVIAEINVTLFLEEFEPTIETSTAYVLLPHILDEAIIIQSLQELDAWKIQKYMQFEEHLELAKEEELKKLTDQFYEHKVELEASLQKYIDKCKKLSCTLKKNIHGLRMEKIVELNKRINDHYNIYFEIHKNIVRYSVSDNQELIEKISELEITISIMRDLLSKQCMHIEEMQKTQLTGDQTKILLRDLKYLEQKYEIVQRDKNYFKTEYEKAVKEVHELKMEDHRNLTTKIACEREALSQLNTDSFATCCSTFEDNSSVRDDDTIADFNLEDISEPSLCDW